MNGRYYSLNEYLKNTFGEKVYKLSLDIGTTCPNRDGTLDTRGCIFCHEGSSHFAAAKGNISEKLQKAKERVIGKTKANKFIAYFQSFTNTYAPVSYLEPIFKEVMEHGDIVAISIGTRPDCLGDDILKMLEDLNKIKPVWVELGLQTSKRETVEYIRRCYENEVYEKAVCNLKKRNIQVITHVILGLPNETREDMTATVDFAVKAGTDGIKLQLLHVLEGTDLWEDYRLGKFGVMSLEEYMDILFDCIQRIPENVVIHRITGDAPKAFLVEPKWSGDKKTVMNTINRGMIRRDIRQGSMVI